MRWQLIVLLVVILLPSVFAQIQVVKENPIEKYTNYSKLIRYSNGTNQVTYHTGQRYVKEDDVWKTVEKANSLKGTAYKCIIERLTKDEPDVVCVDWNWTSVRLNISPDKLGVLPVKYYEKNDLDVWVEKREREENLVINSLNAVDQWYNFKIGDVIHIGENSTVVDIIAYSDINICYNSYYFTSTPTSTNRYFKKSSTAYNRQQWGYVVDIAQGTTIDSAYLNWTPTYIYNGGSSMMRQDFWANDLDDGVAYTSCSNWDGTVTTARTDYDVIPPSALTVGNEYSIPFTAQVQEVLDRGGWSSGNNLYVVSNGVSSTPIISVQFSPNFKLVIEYEGGTPPVGNSCSCPGVDEDWVINMTHECNMTACDLGTGMLSFVDVGWVNCSAEVNTTGMGGIGSGGVLWMGSACQINVI